MEAQRKRPGSVVAPRARHRRDRSHAARSVRTAPADPRHRLHPTSTDEQLLGLDAQRAALKQAFKHRDGQQLVGILADEGFSGKDLERPALRQALEQIATGRADALAVLKLDRLTRHSGDLAALIDWFEYARAGLIALDFEGLDTTKPSGKMIASVLIAVAQWERDMTSERTALALQALRARGKATGRAAVADRPELVAGSARCARR
jgi:DNA invertase Pin-like site-specific DNA recombinase